VFIIRQSKVRRLGWPCPGVLVLVCEDGKFAFYDTATQAERFSFHPGPSESFHSVISFSGDGRWLIAQHGVWDLAPTAAALTAGASQVPEPINHYDGGGSVLVHCLYALDQEGRRALRYVGEDLRVPLIQQLLTLPDFEVQGVCPGPSPCFPYAAALSDRFVVWYERRVPPFKEPQVYSLATGALQARLPHTSGINALVVSRDGRRLATAAGVTVRVWDPESGECIRKFKGQRGNIQAIAFHPSGRFLAVSCLDGTVRFWDVESGRELVNYGWGVGTASLLAFSPDGSTVSAGTPDAVVVWDVDG
jgi:WD40 repeat protein